MDHDHDNLLSAIEQHEAWLNDLLHRCPAPPCPPLEPLKLQVRLAAAGRFTELPGPTPGVVDDVKAAVRRELAARRPRPSSPRPRPNWVVRLGMTGVAAAAVMTIWVMLKPLDSTPRSPGFGVQPPADLIAGRFSDFVEVVVQSDPDEDLVDTEADLAVLTEPLTDTLLFEDEDTLEALAELDEQLDDLLTESTSLVDV